MRADAPGDDRAAAASLGALFRRAGYTSDGVRARLGTEGEVLSRSLDRPVHLRRLTDDAPLDLRIRLFLLGVPVDAETAERGLGAGSIEPLAALWRRRAASGVSIGVACGAQVSRGAWREGSHEWRSTCS